MKKTVIIAACAILVLGIILMTISLKSSGFSFINRNLTFANLMETETVIEQEFDCIDINTSSGNVKLLPSEDNTCRVYTVSHKDRLYDIRVEDGILKIRENEKPFLGIELGVIFADVYGDVTVYLPDTHYRELAVSTASGDVHVPSGFGFDNLSVLAVSGDVSVSAAKAEDVDIITTSGEIRISDVTCLNMGCRTTSGEISLVKIESDSLSCSSVSGDLNIRNSLTKDKAEFKTTSGDVELDSFDANEIIIDTTSGDVEGRLLTGKTYIVDTVSGDIEVPYRAPANGTCTIDTVSGDVEIDAP